jgi:protein involved in polysaccharide export with SLBB domain
MKRFLLLIACLFGLAAIASAQVVIAPGQAIDIRISGVPQEEMSVVNNTYPVSEQGTIRMPFIGTVRAAGMRPDSLAASIEAAYRSAQIYTHPTVQVLSSSDETLKELTVSVGGWIRNPGPVKYVRGLTLYNAVQAAGGATEFGAMNRVGLIRGGQRKEYNLKQTKFMNILVEPNDTIEVPQKNWRGQ